MGDNSTSTCGYTYYIGYAGISLCLVVICNSVLTIVTICRTRELHTNQYIFIASLAVADILLALVFLATDTIHITWLNNIVDDRNIFKNTVYGTMFSCVVLDGLHMSIIAIDRYIRIAHPFYYMQHMTKKRTIKILSVAYVLCFINACIPAIVYQDIKYKHCINIDQPLAYYYSNISLLAINMFVVLLCYSQIILIAITHKKAAMSRRQQTGDVESHIIYRNNRMIIMKSVRYFAAMFGVSYILSIPPFLITNLSFSTSIPDVTVVLAVHCFPLHSALSFFIACCMNQSFFKALQKMFVCNKASCFKAC